MYQIDIEIRIILLHFNFQNFLSHFPSRTFFVTFYLSGNFLSRFNFQIFFVIFSFEDIFKK